MATKWFCFFQIVSIAIRFCKTYFKFNLIFVFWMGLSGLVGFTFSQKKMAIRLVSRIKVWIQPLKNENWRVFELNLSTGSKSSFSNRLVSLLFSLESGSQMANHYWFYVGGHQSPIFEDLEKLEIGCIQIKLVFLAWWDLFSKDFQHKNSFGVFNHWNPRMSRPLCHISYVGFNLDSWKLELFR